MLVSQASYICRPSYQYVQIAREDKFYSVLWCCTTTVYTTDQICGSVKTSHEFAGRVYRNNCTR